MLRALSLAVLVIGLTAGCGAETSQVSPETPPASPRDVSGGATPGPAAIAPETASPPDTAAVEPPRSAPLADAPPAVPLDAVGTGPVPPPCFGDASATPVVLDAYPDPASAFRVSLRGSSRAQRGVLHARPGTTVRFEASIANAGTEVLFLSPHDVTALTTMHVAALDARWTVSLAAASALHAGQRLDPGDVVSVCVAFEVPASPIDAARETERQRAYTLAWAPFSHEGLPSDGVTRRGGGIGLALPTIAVRYAASDAPSVRESGSWFGVIRVVLAEGASALEIASATGIRIGGPAALVAYQHGGMYQPPPPSVPGVIFQAPPSMRVADAVATLAARADVVSAAAVMRGDEETRGCNAYNPCAPEPCCRP